MSVVKETNKFLRILCLHGSEQNAEILRTRLGSMPRKTKSIAKFVFIDAPHTLPLRPGDEVPMRTWYLRDEKGKLNEASLQTSLDYIRSLWDDVNTGNYDGIFGFSMGGTVAAQIALLKTRATRAGTGATTYNSLQFLFVAGAPDRLTSFPGVASNTSSSGTGSESMDCSLHSLHVMGRSDNVVSMALMESLAGRFHEPVVLPHEQGHCLPSKSVYIEQYVAFLTHMHRLHCHRIGAASDGMASTASKPKTVNKGYGAAGAANTSLVSNPNPTVTVNKGYGAAGAAKTSLVSNPNPTVTVNKGYGAAGAAKTSLVSNPNPTVTVNKGYGAAGAAKTSLVSNPNPTVTVPAAAGAAKTSLVSNPNPTVTVPAAAAVVMPIQPLMSNLVIQYEELEALLAIYAPGADGGSALTVLAAHSMLKECDSSGLLGDIVTLETGTGTSTSTISSACASAGCMHRHVATLQLKAVLTTAELLGNISGSTGSALAVPESWTNKVALCITMFGHYPGGGCDGDVISNDQPQMVCELDLADLSILDFPTSAQQSLLSKCRSVILNQCGESNSGGMCVYEVIQAGLDWVSDPQGWTSKEKAHGAAPTNTSTNIAGTRTGTDTGTADAGLPVESAEEEGDDPVLTQQWIRAATEDAHRVSYRVLLGREKCSETEASALPAVSKRRSGGLWHYTVGLVGKPSAGKSTFYNAVTRAALVRDGRGYAPVSPHPFTTIAPNVGPGWFLGPRDDSVELGVGDLKGTDNGAGLLRFPYNYSEQPPVVTTRGAAYGRDTSAAATNRRLLPVVVKDVAGLVPGAYIGRGKGNRFLNDLCDADVLVHIVDASGSATAEGSILGVTGAPIGSNTECSRPDEDMTWVREELHRWIFNNITAKWASIERKFKVHARSVGGSGTITTHGNSGAGQWSSLERLYECMSGYQGSPREDVDTAVVRAGLHSAGPAIGQWTPAERHRFVAHYLSVRFPTCIALNKIDRVFAAEAEGGAGGSYLDMSYIRSLVEEARRRGEVAIPVSAQAEEWTIRKQRLTSSPGDSTASINSTAAEKTSQSQLTSCSDAEFSVMEGILDTMSGSRSRGSGVLDAVTAAVMLKPPVFVYPVQDLDTEVPIGAGMSGAATLGESAHCLLCRPHTTVYELYEDMSRTQLASASVSAIDSVDNGKPSNEHNTGTTTAMEGAMFLCGDFVRCDGTSLAHDRKHQCGRDTIIQPHIAVLRIQTNKKVSWQKNYAK